LLGTKVTSTQDFHGGFAVELCN